MTDSKPSADVDAAWERRIQVVMAVMLDARAYPARTNREEAEAIEAALRAESGQCDGYAGDPGASAPRCESYRDHPGGHFIRAIRVEPLDVDSLPDAFCDLTGARHRDLVERRVVLDRLTEAKQ